MNLILPNKIHFVSTNNNFNSRMGQWLQNRQEFLCVLRVPNQCEPMECVQSEKNRSYHCTALFRWSSERKMSLFNQTNIDIFCAIREPHPLGLSEVAGKGRVTVSIWPHKTICEDDCVCFWFSPVFHAGSDPLLWKDGGWAALFAQNPINDRSMVQSHHWQRCLDKYSSVERSKLAVTRPNNLQQSQRRQMTLKPDHRIGLEETTTRVLLRPSQ